MGSWSWRYFRHLSVGYFIKSDVSVIVLSAVTVVVFVVGCGGAAVFSVMKCCKSWMTTLLETVSYRLFHWILNPGIWRLCLCSVLQEPSLLPLAGTIASSSRCPCALRRRRMLQEWVFRLPSDPLARVVSSSSKLSLAIPVFWVPCKGTANV